ncbi:MAG: tetratricopeptide repeat protein [bacterium]
MSAKTYTLRLVLMVLFCGVAHTAQAVWPFNESDASKAEKLVAQANAQLQAADEVWRVGNMAKAAEFYQAAADIFRQAEQLSPNMQNGLIRFRISYCAGQVDQIQNAAREKAKPEPRVAITHPPGLSRGSGTPAEAEPTSEEQQVDVRRELSLAQRFITGDHPEDAVPSLIKVLHADPVNRNALLLMATVRVQQGRYDDAIVTIEGLRESDEDDAVLLLASGAYCGAGRYFDALLALDKVLKKNPDLPQAHMNMAYLVLEMTPEKRADAQSYYQHAIKLGIPRDALIEKRLGMTP